mgnify:CR=1 FL=1
MSSHRCVLDPSFDSGTHSDTHMCRQTKSKSPPDISSKNVRQLHLNNPPPGSTLARVVPAGAYTRADCINDTTSVYAFTDDTGTNWIVQYNAGLSTSIFPVTTDHDDLIRTFVHFPPHTMVRLSALHPRPFPDTHVFRSPRMYTPSGLATGGGSRAASPRFRTTACPATEPGRLATTLLRPSVGRRGLYVVLNIISTSSLC